MPIGKEEFDDEGIETKERCPNCGNGRVTQLTKETYTKIHGSRFLWCKQCGYRWQQKIE